MHSLDRDELTMFTSISFVPTSFRIFVCSVLLSVCGARDSAAEPASQTKLDHAKVTAAANKAADYFKKTQANDGSFSSSSGPGITAIVGAALLRSGRSPQDPVVAKILKYLEGNVHDDGGIYQKGGNHQNYETCLAIMCFQEANKNHHYD